MKKEHLLSFIDKYHLSGNCESAKWVVTANTLQTSFLTSDRNVIGSVSYASPELPDIELGVYNTGQLIKLMSALDSDVNVNFKKADKQVYAMELSDSNTTASYMLSDLSVIPDAPSLKKLPDFDIKVELSKEFTSRFIKSKNALPESDNFAVESDGSTCTLTINYANINTNKITYAVKSVETPNKMSPVCFSAKLFKEILEANKDCTGWLEVSSAGLGRVTLKNDSFTAVYYLVKLTIN
jgi:hypothetical protein